MSLEKPYSNLARYYRRLMNHVDYSVWGGLLIKIVRQHKLEPASMLEIGAGNGMLCRHFNLPSLKLRITSDLSFAMIADANPVFAGHRVVADARALPFKARFDLALMTYDAINYLDVKGIRDLFRSMRSLLAPKGLFIFDITTERNSLRYFDDTHDALDMDDGLLVRRSWYEEENRKQYNRFDFFERLRSGNYRRLEELHCQTIYSVGELEKLATAEGLRICATYGNFNLQPPGPNADRIHLVLAKN